MRWRLVGLLGALAVSCGNDDSSAAGAVADAGVDADAGGQQDATPDADADAGEVCTSLNDTGVWLPDDGNGAFDPSVATDPATGRVWMSYSSVDGLVGEGRVSTWLVHSDDGGATWCGAARINAAEDVSAPDRPPGLEGFPSHWSHEVSALVFDSSAPTSERWKLFWHRYLHVNDADPNTGDRRFEYGWLAMRAAASAEALSQAPEQVFLAAGGYFASSSTQAYNAGIAGAPLHRLSDVSAEVADCIAVTEPAAVALDGSLRIWLGCASTGGLRIISLQLSGSNLSYLGTPLTPTDAKALNPALTGFNAADAYIDAQGEPRLLISPVAGESYKGCLLYGVSGGSLTGPLAVVKEHTESSLLSGVCAYDPGLTASGTLFGEIHADTPQFRLFGLGSAP